MQETDPRFAAIFGGAAAQEKAAGILAALPGLTDEDLAEAEAQAGRKVGFWAGLIPDSIGEALPGVRQGVRYAKARAGAEDLAAIEGGTAGRETSKRVLGRITDAGQERTFLGGTGEMVQEFALTMGELAIPGMGISKLAALAPRVGIAGMASGGGAALNALGSRATRTLLTLGVGAPAMREVLPRLAGYGGGAISASALQRAMPGVSMTTDEAGRLAVYLESSFQEFLDTPHPMWKGYVDEGIEMAAEATGGPIMKLPVLRLLQGAQIKFVEKALGGFDNDVARFLAEGARAGVYAGPAGEFLENRVATAGKAAVPGMEEEWGDVIPGAREAAQELLAASLVGGAPVAAGAAVVAGKERQRTQAKSEVDEALGDEQAVESESSGLEGGDPSSVGPGAAPVVQGPTTYKPLSRAEREADLQLYVDALAASAVEGEEVARPKLGKPRTRGELALQAIARRRGIDPTFVTGAAKDAPAFYPGEGRMVVGLGAGAYDAGIHEAFHTLWAQQDAEGRQSLERELEGIDPDFLERVAKWRAKNARIETPELAREEALTTGAQVLGTMGRYLRTEQGAADFAKVFEQNVGALRRTGEAIVDMLGTLVRGLPITQRAAARNRLAVLQDALSTPGRAALLAKALNDAFDGIAPVFDAPPVAGESSGNRVGNAVENAAGRSLNTTDTDPAGTIPAERRAELLGEVVAARGARKPVPVTPAAPLPFPGRPTDIGAPPPPLPDESLTDLAPAFRTLNRGVAPPPRAQPPEPEPESKKRDRGGKRAAIEARRAEVAEARAQRERDTLERSGGLDRFIPGVGPAPGRASVADPAGVIGAGLTPRFAPALPPVLQSLNLRRGKRGGKASVADIGEAFEQLAVATGDRVADPLRLTDAEAERIAAHLNEEIEYALQRDKTAVGWYDRKTKAALEIMSQLHPEILSDANARMVFTAVLAITSNGQTVVENFRYAHEVYSEYKRTGRIPSTIGFGGTRQAAIQETLNLLQATIDKQGLEATREFLAGEYRVGDLIRAGYRVDELVDHIAPGSIIFGPKLGAFYGNLNGKFDQLTADLWFARTWNRHTGHTRQFTEADKERMRGNLRAVIEGAPAAVRRAWISRGFTKAAMLRRADPATLDDFASQLEADLRKRFKFRYAQIEGGVDGPLADLYRKANGLVKALAGPLQQAPRNSGERGTMRRVVRRVQEMRRAAGQDYLDVADIQAVLWYFEKDLYTSFGGTNARGESADYEDAARALVAAVTGAGPGRGGAPVGPARAQPAGDGAAERGPVPGAAREAGAGGPLDGSDLGLGPDQGMRFAAAYHGSPHDFDRFDMSKIGTGEGAQAYGHGLYFAGNREVAEHYRRTLARGSTIIDGVTDSAARKAAFDEAGRRARAASEAFAAIVDSKKRGTDTDAERARWSESMALAKAATARLVAVEMAWTAPSSTWNVATAERYIGTLPEGRYIAPTVDQVLGALAALKIKNPGALYQVDLKPAEDEYLLWDEPLSKQSEKVSAALRRLRIGALDKRELDGLFATWQRRNAEAVAAVKLAADNPSDKLLGILARRAQNILLDANSAYAQAKFDADSGTGEQTYRGLAAAARAGRVFWMDGAESADAVASKTMLAAGIRGIKYLDGMSRGKGEGAYNYVLFDDADVTIEGKFAPSLAGMLGAIPRIERAQVSAAVDWLRLRIQDDTIPIREFPELRTAVKRSRAKSPARQERFQEAVDALLKPLGPSAATIRDVQRAMYHTAGLERNKWMLAERGTVDGSGTSDGEHSRALAEIRQRVGAKLVDDFLAGIARLNKERLDHLVETRMVDAPRAALWHAREPHWVSMRDLDPTADEHVGFETSGRSVQVKNPQIRKAKGRTDEAENALLAWYTETLTRMRAAEKNRAMHVGADLARKGTPGLKVIPKPQGVPGGFTAPADHVAFVDGAQQMYLVMASEDAAAALKGLNGEQTGFVLNGIGKLTRMFSRNVTGRNPFFWTPNMLRDSTMAFWTVSAERDIRQGAQILGRAWASLPGMIRYQLTGDTRGVPYIEAAKRAGFKTTWIGRATLQELLDDFRTKVEGPTSIRDKVRASLAFLEKVGDAFEMSTRYAAFAHDFERHTAAGKSSEEAEALAGDFARELTLNFDTRGTWTPALSSLYAFFNPAVQGSARLMKAALNGPRGAAAVGAAIMLGAIFEALGYALGDDDPETGLNEYGSLPEWEKSRNLVMPFKIGGAYPKVTLSYGLDAIVRLGARGLHVASGGSIDPRQTPAKAIQEGVLHAASTFNPLGDVSDPFALATPTVFRPFTEIERNVKFGDRPVMKDATSFGTTLPDSARAFSTIADRFSGWLGQRIADVLNMYGPEELPTGLDVSPESMQHLIEFAMSGFGLRELDRVTEFSLSRREVPLSANLPVLRNFAATVTSHHVSEEFHKIKNTASTLHGLAKNAENADDLAAIRARDPRAWALKDRAAKIDRRLSDIRKQLRSGDLTVAQERELRERMTSWEARIVGAYYARD